LLEPGKTAKILRKYDIKVAVP